MRRVFGAAVPAGWRQRVTADLEASGPVAGPVPEVATAGTEHLAAGPEKPGRLGSLEADAPETTLFPARSEALAEGLRPEPLPHGVLGYVVAVTVLKGPGGRPERAGLASADLIPGRAEAEAIAGEYRALPPDNERRVCGWGAAVCEVRAVAR